MCGIVGMVSGYTDGFSDNELKAFRDMLFYDTLRGFDSTGVFGVDIDSNVDILKSTDNGANFVQTKEFNQFRDTMFKAGKFVVGHNRAATRGVISDENAHPFWVNNNTVLVQNGTHHGDHTHLANTDVDTEAIAQVIDREPDLEKAFQQIDAAFALVWYNVKERTLNLIRNDERPLCFAYTDNGGIMFASEIDMISMAAKRNNLKLKDEPYLIKDDHLVQITLLEGGKHSQKVKDINTTFKGYSQKYVKRGWDMTAYQQPYEKQEHKKNMKFKHTSNVFPDHAIQLLPQYFLTEGQANLALDYLKEKKEANKGKVTVQVIDWVPTSTSPNTDSYFVYGEILETEDDTPAGNIPVYWTVYNTSKAQMADKFNSVVAMKVTLQTPVMRNFYTHGQQYHLVSVFCTDQKELVEYCH